jgi:hypothetical protein
MKLTPCQAVSKEECEVCRELFSDALSMISAGPEADQYGKIEKGYFDWWDPQQYVRVCHTLRRRCIADRVHFTALSDRRPVYVMTTNQYAS